MKNIKVTVILVMLLLMAISIACQSEGHYHLSSPDGDLKVFITNENGHFSFYQTYRDDTLIGRSPLGLLAGGTDLSDHIEITGVTEKAIDTTWNTVIGKCPEVRNHYKEYRFNCRSLNDTGLNYTVVFRCYNDGFAYRYSFPEREGIKEIQIEEELTRLNFPENFRYWAYNGERHNLGPLDRKEQETERVSPPMVIETANKVYFSMQEAGIIRYAPFELRAAGGDYSVGISLIPTTDALPLKTSWRSFIIGDRPGDLAGSNLLANLNEPCRIDDPSWIRPGKALWDWRVWGYVAEDGFEYGLNTVSHKRMIDFAAANNIQYLLIDADWYGPEFSEDSDPTIAREGIDIEECMAYAGRKEVGVILYLNDVGARKYGLERVLRQFSEWGAAGVKYGFMRDKDMEQKVRYTREVTELCARYKLMVDFHDGPVPPSGDHRTWPNLVSKEFCHAQADAKRSYFPETAVNTAFINMICGPLDATNGWFDLNNAHSRVKVFEEIPGTVAAEVAKLIVVYTGLMVLPDSPEEYAEKADLFDCIRNMPSQFDSFRVLEGEIDEYIIVVRRAGDDWFVGSLTNREARRVKVDFSFLPDNRAYRARLYEDGKDAHFTRNKESYEIRETTVYSRTMLEINMAAGGGHAIHLSPEATESLKP